MSQLQEQQFKDQGSILPFLRRTFSYAMRHPKWFGTFIGAVMIVAITDALYPLLWKYFIDSLIMPTIEASKASWAQGIQPAIDYTQIAYFVSLFLLNSSVQVIAVFFFIRYAGMIEETVVYELRKEMFAKLQQLSFSYYDKSAAGWLLSRITSDSKKVTQLISWGFLDVVWAVNMIFFCLAFMFYYSWKLTLIIMISIPILIVVAVKIRLLILKYSRQARKINSEITASYSEHLNGVQVNKITAQEERVSDEFRGLSNNMRRASFRAAFHTALYMPLVIFIGSLAAGLILYFGGNMAIATTGGITVGTLAAFFTYATQIFWPILDIARFYALAQGCLSAGERIYSLIDEEPEIQNKEGASDFKEIKGNIEFRAINFHYVPEKPILQNINLQIQSGQSIALVGETGGGKSTITNLIGRFYEAQSGQLLIDGENIYDKTIHSLRSQLGVVLQTPHLFSGTVIDNIRYGNQQASEEEVITALQMVGAGEFAERLTEEVGESGDKLSMGEKQLISFARAILTNPRIIIMDEATSSIDTLTEARIQKGIQQIIAGRTAVIIAHRLSTIKHCDRILVIRNGQIVEDGSHQDLLAEEGYYYRLYTGKKEVVIG